MEKELYTIKSRYLVLQDLMELLVAPKAMVAWRAIELMQSLLKFPPEAGNAPLINQGICCKVAQDKEILEHLIGFILLHMSASNRAQWTDLEWVASHARYLFKSLARSIGPTGLADVGRCFSLDGQEITRQGFHEFPQSQNDTVALNHKQADSCNSYFLGYICDTAILVKLELSKRAIRHQRMTVVANLHVWAVLCRYVFSPLRLEHLTCPHIRTTRTCMLTLKWRGIMDGIITSSLQLWPSHP